MARAPEMSFLCTQVTLQSHVFLSCKSTESGGLQLFHLAAASSSPFFDWLLSKESSFGFAVSTDPAAGVTQFKFQGSLTWVTSSESCPSSWNKSLLKEVTESRMWFYLSVYSSWCKWICPFVGNIIITYTVGCGCTVLVKFFKLTLRAVCLPDCKFDFILFSCNHLKN